jgi:hypothetical protein
LLISVFFFFLVDDWETAHRKLAGLELQGDIKPTFDDAQSSKKPKVKGEDDTNLEEVEVQYMYNC